MPTITFRKKSRHATARIHCAVVLCFATFKARGIRAPPVWWHPP